MASRESATMMSIVNARAKQVLEQAKALTTEERGELVHELLQLLDAETDADAASAWAEELEKRGREALANDPPGRDMDDFLARLNARDLGRR